MMKIYSKLKPKLLIACVIHKNEIKDYRQDLSPDEEFLQVSARSFEKETFVKPHKHLINNREINKTQEAWIIIEGKVEFQLFDIDDHLIESSCLESGDCLVLYNGGHSLNVVEENTIMYEIKNGPYLGIDKDKVNL